MIKPIMPTQDTRGILWAVPAAGTTIAAEPIQHAIRPAEHLTLAYNVRLSDWASWLGHQFSATIFGDYWDDKSQAYSVDLPSGITCRNEFAHITISHAEGVNPNRSNELFKLDTTKSRPLCIPAIFEIRFYDFSTHKEIPMASRSTVERNTGDTRPPHYFDLGTLVELDNGCRLYVVKTGRDLDASALYWLGTNLETMQPMTGAYSESSLSLP